MEDSTIRKVRPVAPIKINGYTLFIGDVYSLYKNHITDSNGKTVCENYNCYQLQEVLCNSELL